MSYYIYGDYLVHHGILGMKWGVRRYQNPDGTLTEEGKVRYGDVTKRSANSIRKQAEALSKNPNSNAAKKINELRDKIQKDAFEKAEKTDAGREYNQLNNYLSELDRQLKNTYGENAQMVLGEADAKYVNGVYEKYRNTIGDFLKEHEEEYYGTYLRELGYNDTSEGRRYVSDILEGDIKKQFGRN